MDGRCDQVWSKTVLDAWHAVQNLRKALLDSLQGQAIALPWVQQYQTMKQDKAVTTRYMKWRVLPRHVRKIPTTCDDVRRPASESSRGGNMRLYD